MPAPIMLKPMKVPTPSASTINVPSTLMLNETSKTKTPMARYTNNDGSVMLTYWFRLRIALNYNQIPCLP